MEIVTNYNKYSEDVILLDEVSITYIQEPDCTEDKDSDYQKLTISTRDNGVAKFLNIKTDNWSIDSTQDLVGVIEDFCKRINYEDTNNS
jgi:hypothetical protein